MFVRLPGWSAVVAIAHSARTTYAEDPRDCGRVTIGINEKGNIIA
jgi:hypothetical protein